MSGEIATPPPPDLREPQPSPRHAARVRDDLEAAALDGDMEAEIEAEIEAMMAAEKENVPLTGFDEGGGSAVDAGTNGHERESMYVRLFDEMITTVLEHESYLFTEREAWVLRHILSFPYEPHYLLTRLLLRRPGRVFPLSGLVDAYAGEIGAEGVRRAARVLAWALDVPPSIEDEDEEEAEAEQATRVESTTGAALAPDPVDNARPWANISTGLSKAEEDADPEFAEALRQSAWVEETGLSADEYLRACDASINRSRTAGPSCIAGPSKVVADDTKPAIPSESETKPATSSVDTAFTLAPLPSPRIIRLAHDESELPLDALMRCVGVDELRRVARARKIPPSMLSTRESTMAALHDAARRQTTLDFGLGSGITDRKGKGKARDTPLLSRRTSKHLVAAELLTLVGDHVLRLDEGLSALIARVNLVFSRTPAVPSQPALLLPPILVASHKRHYPVYGTPIRSRIWSSRAAMLEWERAAGWDALVSDALGDTWAQQRTGSGAAQTFRQGQQMSRSEGARVVRAVWAHVWPVWKAMVAADAPPPDGVVGDRFRTEHVLTRVVYKGAEALGVLHEYDLECEVLRALLAQRRWRRGKRGAWFERLALVLMTHYRGIPTAEERTSKLEDATQVCIDGLLDDDTHLIYRPGLSRRLTRLEVKLNLPPEERHISHAALLTCETRELVGMRAALNAGIRRAEEEGLQMDDDNDDAQPTQAQAQPQQVGKSVWVGRDGEVTVEGWVLEWWKAKGYEGYHAESSILTTLFALLMWPVLFHPLPGAFETAYQTAPLDLGDDGFARARADILGSHLARLEDTTTALQILHETDERERPRSTWAVGLSWDFEPTHLSQILECLGGPAAAAICRMLAEEYRHRASGVPDLIVWDYAAREVRFVEVKGPGDSLSETQKIWIDVLLGAGVPVEVCRVKDKAAEEEREERDKEREARKTKGKVGGSNGPVNGNNGGSSNGSLKRNISSNSNSGNNKATAKSRINGGPPKTPTPKGATRTPLKRGGSGGASLHEPIVLDDSDDDDIEVVDVKRRKV